MTIQTAPRARVEAILLGVLISAGVHALLLISGTQGSALISVLAGAWIAIWYYGIKQKKPLRSDGGALMGLAIGVLSVPVAAGVAYVLNALGLGPGDGLMETWRAMGIPEEDLAAAREKADAVSVPIGLHVVGLLLNAFVGLVAGFVGVLILIKKPAPDTQEPAPEAQVLSPDRLPSRTVIGLTVSFLALGLLVAGVSLYASLLEASISGSPGGQSMHPLGGILALGALAGMMGVWVVGLIGSGVAVTRLADHARAPFAKGLAAVSSLLATGLIVYAWLLMV